MARIPPASWIDKLGRSVAEADAAASGDSNDIEIERLQEALSDALDLIDSVLGTTLNKDRT